MSQEEMMRAGTLLAVALVGLWGSTAHAAPGEPLREERDLAPAQAITLPPTATALDEDGRRTEPAGEPAAADPDSEREVVAPRPRRDAPQDDDEPKKKLITGGGFHISLGFGPMSVPLGHATFQGGGRPLGAPGYYPFAVKGKELGVDRPLFWGGEIAVRYTRRYFLLGIVGGFGHGGTVEHEPKDMWLSNRVDRTHMNLYTAAIEIAAVVPAEPITLRFGPVAGFRHATAPLPGFEPDTCTARSKSRGSYTYSCPFTAKATTPFVQPRVSFEVTLPKGPSIGAWAGVDVYPQIAWSGGIAISIGVPFWDLAP